MYVRIVPVANATARPKCWSFDIRKRRFQRVRHRPEIALEHSRQLVYVLARDVARVAAQPLCDLSGGDPFVEPDSQQVDHQDCPPPNMASLAPSPTAFPTAWTNAFVRL